MEFDFPFIYVEYEHGKKYKYNINEMIPEREEYKKLLDKDFFNSATLEPGGWAIILNDFIDMHGSGVAEFGEEIK